MLVGLHVPGANELRHSGAEARGLEHVRHPHDIAFLRAATRRSAREARTHARLIPETVVEDRHRAQADLPKDRERLVPRVKDIVLVGREGEKVRGQASA